MSYKYVRDTSGSVTNHKARSSICEETRLPYIRRDAEQKFAFAVDKAFILLGLVTTAPQKIHLRHLHITLIVTNGMRATQNVTVHKMHLWNGIYLNQKWISGLYHLI